MDAPPEIERGITRCWQHLNFHVYMAGPCFGTIERARSYRDDLDKRGLKWWPQGEPMPPPPATKSEEEADA